MTFDFLFKFLEQFYLQFVKINIFITSIRLELPLIFTCSNSASADAQTLKTIVIISYICEIVGFIDPKRWKESADGLFLHVSEDIKRIIRKRSISHEVVEDCSLVFTIVRRTFGV